MKVYKWCIISILFMLMLSGCSLFEFHPYSVKIAGKTDTNTKYAGILEESGLELPIKFAFITDTQGSLDEMRRAVYDIIGRGDIDFIVHGGDQTDFGLPKEYVWSRDILELSGLPYISVIGNHDCLGNGNDTFNDIFGPENFSFNVAHTHFLCLNTIALEYDYSRPVPDLDFIERDCKATNELNRKQPGSITHTVVIMHSRPYDEQFNNNVAKPFNEYISHFPGMKGDGKIPSFCINGHNHSMAVEDIFQNGILYYQAPNIAKRAYFIFTITEESYEYEVVSF
ncbi:MULTISPECIES: metallophosphoesterase [Muribaculum]|uniref:Metallophosphoesterase n=1 Tax=Muribaculum caecicola TaxID=3038144 RepID=A0AC61S737_9BACT|nr:MULTISPECIES: metallophosphoesterase [Muribaculum]THG54490.1 metallophosphoesterase [Muribaculum caecicola]